MGKFTSGYQMPCLLVHSVVKFDEQTLQTGATSSRFDRCD